MKPQACVKAVTKPKESQKDDDDDAFQPAKPLKRLGVPITPASRAKVIDVGLNVGCETGASALPWVPTNSWFDLAVQKAALPLQRSSSEKSARGQKSRLIVPVPSDAATYERRFFLEVRFKQRYGGPLVICSWPLTPRIRWANPPHFPVSRHTNFLGPGPNILTI